MSVELVEGVATDLPLPNGSADLVISRHVFWTMTDPRAAVIEWMRVARPGGRVAWFDWLAPVGGAEQQGRHLLGAAVRRLQRLDAPHEDHAYPQEAYERLPMRALADTRAMESFLLGLGVGDATVRRLPRLAAAERRGQPLYRRIEDGSDRYLAGFIVTRELKRRTGSER